MAPILYPDNLIQITDHTIRFQRYYFPFGSKNLELPRIDHVKVPEPTQKNGKWRIHGTGDFRTWFPRDRNRPGPDCIFMLHRREKRRRIGVTSENSEAVIRLVEQKYTNSIRKTWHRLKMRIYGIPVSLRRSRWLENQQ